jgi:hypothetical protein
VEAFVLAAFLCFISLSRQRNETKKEHYWENSAKNLSAFGMIGISQFLPF